MIHLDPVSISGEFGRNGKTRPANVMDPRGAPLLVAWRWSSESDVRNGPATANNLCRVPPPSFRFIATAITLKLESIQQSARATRRETKWITDRDLSLFLEGGAEVSSYNNS